MYVKKYARYGNMIDGINLEYGQECVRKYLQ